MGSEQVKNLLDNWANISRDEKIRVINFLCKRFGEDETKRFLVNGGYNA